MVPILYLLNICQVHHGGDQDLRARPGGVHDVVPLPGPGPVHEAVLDRLGVGIPLVYSFLQLVKHVNKDLGLQCQTSIKT